MFGRGPPRGGLVSLALAGILAVARRAAADDEAERRAQARRAQVMELEASLPEVAPFRSWEELHAACREVIVGVMGDQRVTLEHFRLATLLSYQGRDVFPWEPPLRYPELYQLRTSVAVQCPLAAQLLLLIRWEQVLRGITGQVAHSRDHTHTSFNEIKWLTEEFGVLENYLLGAVGPGNDEDDEWPVRIGLGRVQHFYDFLWGEADDATGIWERLDNPEPVSDETFHKAMAEVAQLLDEANAEWWPSIGTLIALLRHGRRAGRLSRGLMDIVTGDIDIMVGVSDEKAWLVFAAELERKVAALGWSRCVQKSSQDARTDMSLRSDILYCIRQSPEPLILDMASYITGVPGPDVFAHRMCNGRPVDGTSALAEVGECEVIPDQGPFKHWGGRLDRASIYPLARCRAGGISVPCPREPFEVLRASRHSNLDVGCVALPTTRNRDADDPWTQRLSEGGLTSEDVRVLQDRAARLKALGYQSMAPYFERCSGVVVES